jgi:hypothetical protein
LILGKTALKDSTIDGKREREKRKEKKGGEDELQEAVLAQRHTTANGTKPTRIPIIHPT